MVANGCVNKAFDPDTRKTQSQGSYTNSRSEDSMDHENNNETHKSSGEGGIPRHRAWIAMSLCLLCYNTAFMATIPVTTQYLSSRIGEDQYNFTNFTHRIPCKEESNDSRTSTTDKIQKEVSTLSLLINYASSIPAIITCLPYGTLSDHLGRKKILLIPLFGAIGRTLMYVFVVKFRLSLNFLFIGSAIDGLCGSYHATSMITGSIVADITASASNRAISFAIIECIVIFSSSVSNLSVGYLIAWDGYFYPVLIMTCLVFISLLVIVFLLPETLVVKKLPSKNPFAHLKRIVSFYIFEGTRLRKTLFQLGMFMFFFNIVISIGRSTVETLYQLNSPFCWESERIGEFSAAQSFVQILSSVIALRVLRTYLALETIGMTSLLGAICGFVLEGLAKADWMLYLVPLVGLIIYTITPITRALLSRMAGPSQQGALFASLSVVDALCGILSFTLYNTIYMSTLGFYKGTVFFVMAGVCAINFILFGVFKKLSARYHDTEGAFEGEKEIGLRTEARPEDLADKSLKRFGESNSYENGGFF